MEVLRRLSIVLCLTVVSGSTQSLPAARCVLSDATRATEYSAGEAKASEPDIEIALTPQLKSSVAAACVDENKTERPPVKNDNRISVIRISADVPNATASHLTRVALGSKLAGKRRRPMGQRQRSMRSSTLALLDPDGRCLDALASASPAEDPAFCSRRL